MAIYMQIPGVKGNVTASGYEGWVELSDLDFLGITTPVHMTVGRTVDRSESRSKFGYIVAIKHQDASSTALFEHAHSHLVFPTIDIHYVTTGDTLTTYAQTKLTNAAVTHYSERHNTELNRPEELIHLSYTKIERTFINRDQQNNLMSPVRTGYDLEQAQKL